jgi:hypothetical protein
MSLSKDLVFDLSKKKDGKGGSVEYDVESETYFFVTHKEEGKKIFLELEEVKRIAKLLEKWAPVYKDMVEKGCKQVESKVVNEIIFENNAKRVSFSLNIYQQTPNMRLSAEWKDREFGTWHPCKGGNILNDVDPVEFRQFMDDCAKESAAHSKEEATPIEAVSKV